MTQISNYDVKLVCKINLNFINIAATNPQRAIELAKDRLENSPEFLNFGTKSSNTDVTVSFDGSSYSEGDHTATFKESIPDSIIEQSQEMKVELEECKTTLTSLLTKVTGQDLVNLQNRINEITEILERI